MLSLFEITWSVKIFEWSTEVIVNGMLRYEGELSLSSFYPIKYAEKVYWFTGKKDVVEGNAL